METKNIKFFIDAFEAHKKANKPLQEFADRLKFLFMQGELTEKEFAILKQIIDDGPETTKKASKKLPVTNSSDGCSPTKHVSFGRC